MCRQGRAGHYSQTLKNLLYYLEKIITEKFI